MNRIATVLCTALVAVFLMAGIADAKVTYVPKVDNFILFLDYSGSMSQKNDNTGVRQMVAAKKVINDMLTYIPALDYKSGFSTFAPCEELVAMSPYDAGTIQAAAAELPDDFPLFDRRTPMGKGLESITPTIDKLSGKTALIIISDGEQNLGADPVMQAQKMASTYRGRLCIHVISLADTAWGQQVLDGVAAASDCSVATTAAALEDGAAMQQFVKDVFYDEVVTEDPKPAPKKMEMKPEPAPAPAPEPVKEVITFRSVTFDFDSARIKGVMAPVLDEAVSILKGTEGMIELSGHTCNIGPDAYNMGLSQRRADSVKSYLVNKGVSEGRIETKAYGETAPKYDNTTREGRSLNRRVEIQLD